MSQDFSSHFPNLGDVESKKTSEPDFCYNCIAWAFEDNTRFWWPNMQGAYWPRPANSSQSDLEAFDDWLLADGWVQVATAEFENGFKKVALYAQAGAPTHAARLLPSGVWTSKLGQNIDLSHALSDLEGPTYGQVLKIFRKPI